MYRDRKTNIGNIKAPMSSPARFAPVTVRLRKNDSGSSGAADLASITANPTINAPAAVSKPIVAAEAQPWLPAVTTAYTSSVRPPVTVTAPAASKRRWPRPARLSGSKNRAAATISAPTGRLTKKIHGHDSQVVSIPPASTPIAAPAPVTAPNAPSALLRSAPSGNRTKIRASAAGAISAAPTPSTARAAISAPAEPASPQASEAAVNTAAPMIKTRRRPSRSASRPPSSKNPPNASAYALSTHCRPTGENPSPRWIAGNASVTIDPSMTTSNWASKISPSARPRCRACPSAGPRAGLMPGPAAALTMLLITFLPKFFFDRRTVQQGQVLRLNSRNRHLGVSTRDSLPARVSLPGCKAEGTIGSLLRLPTAVPTPGRGWLKTDYVLSSSL